MVVYQVPINRRKRSFFEELSLTNKLIFINVLAYIVFYILDLTNVLSLNYIAISPAGIINNFYLWTFITSMFMHGGIFHLFVNMLSLFFVGSLIERIIGPKRYLVFYLAAGIFSGLLYVFSGYLYPENMNVLAVGASGALFGLIGSLILLTPNLPVYLMFVPIPIKMKYAAPGMLIVLWIISEVGKVPIGNIAHLGGLIAGIVYGFYLRKKFPNKTRMISRRFS